MQDVINGVEEVLLAQALILVIDDRTVDVLADSPPVQYVVVF